MTASSEETVRLPGGETIGIRPIQPDDKALLAEGFRRLSQRSRERRFLTPATDLSTEDLVYLTEVDHRRHEALVAIAPDDGRFIGVARYVQVPGEREVAEVAVVVADDWQRRGVATALLMALSSRARENGVLRYRAYVSSDNEVVIDALGRAGAKRSGEDDPDEIEFNVDVPTEGLGDRLRTALRAAAAGQLRAAANMARRLGVWPR